MMRYGCRLTHPTMGLLFDRKSPSVQTRPDIAANPA
jgi:hypothetical protein